MVRYGRRRRRFASLPPPPPPNRRSRDIRPEVQSHGHRRSYASVTRDPRRQYTVNDITPGAARRSGSVQQHLNYIQHPLTRQVGSNPRTFWNQRYTHTSFEERRCQGHGMVARHQKRNARNLDTATRRPLSSTLREHAI